MTETIPADMLAAQDADGALKARLRTVWALGDYSAVATEIIPALGGVLVEACGVGPGLRVLDVAAGTGNVAIPVAGTGARVVASDLTPELLLVGRRAASQHGVELEWREADAEALPFDDETFDIVLSCVGVMFAPHHQVAADEMVRVCRPGGTIGLLNWTPEGFIGRMFATMSTYAPPAAPGVQSPPLWGVEEYVADLFGDRVADLAARREVLRVDHFGTAGAFREYFKARYGPTIAVYRSLAADPSRVAELDRDLDRLVEEHDHGTGSTVLDWEYLQLTARKRG